MVITDLADMWVDLILMALLCVVIVQNLVLSDRLKELAARLDRKG